MAKTKNIQFICPECSKSKFLEVPITLYTRSETGTTPIVIPAGTVCEHEIHSYIDKNGMVRGYIQFEYNIMSTTAKIQKSKKDAIAAYGNHYTNNNIEFILEIIDQYDLLSLIECCFMRYPIVLLENNPENERFKLFYCFLNSLYPKLAEKILIYSMSEYDELIKSNSFSNYFVYNVTHRLRINCPVSVDQSYNLEFLLKHGYLKNYMLFNNALRYLDKYGDYVAEFMLKPPKTIFKQLEKEKGAQKWLTLSIVEMIYDRNEFIARFHLSMWNDDSLLSDALKKLIPLQKAWDQEKSSDLEDMEQKLSKLKEGLWG